MLTYILKEIKEGIKYYNFYPCGDRSVGGEVAFNIATGERTVISDSSIDVASYYACHALTGIDLDKKSGTVAWC